jgi:hypothetical protein
MVARIFRFGTFTHQAYDVLSAMGSADSPEAKDRIELAKKDYSTTEITPLFMGY